MLVSRNEAHAFLDEVIAFYHGVHVSTCGVFFPFTGEPWPGDKLNPEIRELVGHMEEDPLLRHEVLVYFYKYKENRQDSGNSENNETP